jgi:hypothetical protein
LKLVRFVSQRSLSVAGDRHTTTAAAHERAAPLRIISWSKSAAKVQRLDPNQRRHFDLASHDWR